MNTFISPEYASLLRQHQLDSFSALWGYQGEWFELPNRERGGWSGVNYIELSDDTGQKHSFYLKRQQGHMRKSWRHPLDGEPTFVREYKILQYLTKYHVATPELVFFAAHHNQAILMTKALTGFVSVDQFLKTATHLTIKSKRALMQSLAGIVRQLHDARVQHRSLYDKHLFVKELVMNGQAPMFDVAMIDFEKSRISQWIIITKLFDLMTLHYRTDDLSCTHRLYFFKQYFKVNKLTFFYKNIFNYMRLHAKKT